MNFIKQFSTLFSLSLLVIVSSCKKPKVEETPVAAQPTSEQLEIHIHPFFGTNELVLDQPFVLPNGNKIKMSDIKLFLTEIKNGSKVIPGVGFFNYRETGSLAFKSTGKSVDYSALTFNLGVNEPLNNADPSIPENSSPLNILNAGDMHWGWNFGYIFVNLEGKIDSLAAANPNYDVNISYHIGTNVYLANVSLTNLTWVTEGGIKKLHLRFNLLDVFNGAGGEIVPKTESFTHSGHDQDSLTVKFINNFKNAIIPQ